MTGYDMTLAKESDSIHELALKISGYGEYDIGVSLQRLEDLLQLGVIWHGEQLRKLKREDSGHPPCYERYKYLVLRAEVAVGEALTKKRTLGCTLIRSFIAHQLHKEGYTYSEIGRTMGRDHSTVMVLVRRAEDMLSLPEAYKSEMEMMEDFQKLI